MFNIVNQTLKSHYENLKKKVSNSAQTTILQVVRGYTTQKT